MSFLSCDLIQDRILSSVIASFLSPLAYGNFSGFPCFFRKTSIFLKGIFQMFVECPLFRVCFMFCHDQIEVMSLREEYQKGKVPFSLYHIKGCVISSWFIPGDATLTKWLKKLLFFFFFESKSPSPVNTQVKEH